MQAQQDGLPAAALPVAEGRDPGGRRLADRLLPPLHRGQGRGRGRPGAAAAPAGPAGQWLRAARLAAVVVEEDAGQRGQQFQDQPGRTRARLVVICLYPWITESLAFI